MTKLLNSIFCCAIVMNHAGAPFPNFFSVFTQTCSVFLSPPWFVVVSCRANIIAVPQSGSIVVHQAPMAEYIASGHLHGVVREAIAGGEPVV